MSSPHRSAGCPRVRRSSRRMRHSATPATSSLSAVLVRSERCVEQDVRTPQRLAPPNGTSGRDRWSQSWRSSTRGLGNSWCRVDLGDGRRAPRGPPDNAAETEPTVSSTASAIAPLDGAGTDPQPPSFPARRGHRRRWSGRDRACRLRTGRRPGLDVRAAAIRGSGCGGVRIAGPGRVRHRQHRAVGESGLGLAGRRRTDASRLDRAGHCRRNRGPALHRQPRSGPQGRLRRRRLRELAEILGAADGYPELKAKPAFMSVGPQRRTIRQTDPRNREREDAHPRQHPPATKPGAIPPTRESQLDPASVAPLLRHEGCSLGPTLEVQLR